MIPTFRICDRCGRMIDLVDGKIHTEWSEHTAHCDVVPIDYSSTEEGSCLIDFIFEKHLKGDRPTLVPASKNNTDLCDDCKLMLLENAANVLRKHGNCIISENTEIALNE